MIHERRRYKKGLVILFFCLELIAIILFVHIINTIFSFIGALPFLIGFLLSASSRLIKKMTEIKVYLATERITSKYHEPLL